MHAILLLSCKIHFLVLIRSFFLYPFRNSKTNEIISDILISSPFSIYSWRGEGKSKLRWKRIFGLATGFFFVGIIQSVTIAIVGDLQHPLEALRTTFFWLGSPISILYVIFADLFFGWVTDLGLSLIEGNILFRKQKAE